MKFRKRTVSRELEKKTPGTDTGRQRVSRMKVRP